MSDLLDAWIYHGSYSGDPAVATVVEHDSSPNQEIDVKSTMALLLTIKPFFERDFGTRLSGSQIINEVHGQSGVIYPVLHRLLAAGWLESEEEQIDPTVAKRPKRRFFKLTVRGAQKGHKLMTRYLPDPNKFLRGSKSADIALGAI